MWLVMCVAAVLVLAQYHVSSSWLGGLNINNHHQHSGVGAGGGLDTNDVGDVGLGRPPNIPLPSAPPGAVPAAASASSSSSPLSLSPAPTIGVGLSALEEAVRLSVQKLADNDAMAASLGARLLHEVAKHLQLQDLAPTAAAAEECKPAGLQPPTPRLVPLFVVTPTYRRPEQVAELTRLSQTLLLVRNVRWIVVEDAKTPSKQVAELLRRSGLPHEHLTAPMPEQYHRRRGAKPKGVSQRNRAIQWLRANASRVTGGDADGPGILYFADDDNTYDIRIFEEIRTTKRVSMFPVGLCTKYGLSTPVVSKTGSFLGFYDGWVGGRKFPVDMAGFAVNVKFLLQRPKAAMPYVPGFEEDGFLRSLAPFEPREVELLADNCTKVLVWHTQTKANAPSLSLDKAKYNNTNLAVLKSIIV